MILGETFTAIKEKRRIFETLLIAFLLLISGLAHGYNMFHYPYYENDEGTYMSQAWSLLTQGKLAPYTYWYDHAPAGWILIAAWVKLTGGFFTFGNAINSGRVFMLAIHLFTSLLLFYITKKITGHLFPGIIAVMIFSLSPLAIYFQRRVLLDNIMIFWVLSSLALVLKSNLKLRFVLLSALCLGIAILTKENAIFFLPAFLYTIYAQTKKESRNFAIAQWLAVAGLVVSTYFLYALLQGEFLPAGINDKNPHVSLLSTLKLQYTRGADVPFWHEKSDFFVNLNEWIKKDAFTIVIGAAATFVSLFLSVKEKKLRLPSLLALLFWIFLIRGKIVIDFYVIPAIPLLALNLGVLLDTLTRKYNEKMRYFLQTILIFFLLGGVYYATIIVSLNPYVSNETGPQNAAVKWIKENLSEDAYMVIDNYSFVDLRDKNFLAPKSFLNADWFWKIDYDPDVFQKKYQNDWTKIEYIILSHEMVKQMGLGSQKTLKRVYESSNLVTLWKNKYGSYFDLKNLISNNGDWIAVFKLNVKEKVMLKLSWEYFKNNFIKSYGQIIDPANNDATTSEGQSYTMLRAVWEDDRQTFDNVWQWTKDHLQHRLDDKLLSWLWIKDEDGKNYKMGDSAAASDADEDAALSLLFAYKKWGDQKYLNEAKEIINDIWKKEVVVVNRRYLLVCGPDLEKKTGYLVNPSYFSPAAYRIFAEVDRSHPWEKLADDSYYFLEKIVSRRGNQIGLPPNWIVISRNGEITSASPYVEKDPDLYGFDAFRIVWRIALDNLWFKTTKSTQYLQKIEPFFQETWIKNQSFPSLFTLSGEEKSFYRNISTASAPLSLFSITNPDLSKRVFENIFRKNFDFAVGSWENPKDYYDQSWGWFGTAFYLGSLPNLWK